MRSTFRSLESRMRIGPLELMHWVYVLIALSALWAFVKFGPLPIKPAISIGAFFLTPLAGLLIMGDESGVTIATRVVGAIRWRFLSKRLAAGGSDRDKRPGLLVSFTEEDSGGEVADLSELWEPEVAA